VIFALRACTAQQDGRRSSNHRDARTIITADVEDANGVIVPTAENSITFSLSGPAELVGVDNGNPIDTSSYKGNSRKAFSGKALAILRSTTTAGNVVLTASATGLTSEPVSVTTE